MTTSTTRTATTIADTQRRLDRASATLDRLEADYQRRRSLELARLRGHTLCSWAARLVAEQFDQRSGALLSATYRIDSASQAARQYTVTYTTAADDAQCDCQAAQFGRSCWHRGLGLIKGRYLARRAQRGWLED